jgi:hypothetical protein
MVLSRGKKFPDTFRSPPQAVTKPLNSYQLHTWRGLVDERIRKKQRVSRSKYGADKPPMKGKKNAVSHHAGRKNLEDWWGGVIMALKYPP